MVYTPFFSLQNAVCFIILTYLVPVSFTFYIQDVLKLKKNNSGSKRLMMGTLSDCLLRSAVADVTRIVVLRCRSVARKGYANC